MENKRAYYIIFIAVASAVLLSLLLLAGCVSKKPSGGNTEPSGGTKAPSVQTVTDPSGEDAAVNDTTTGPQSSTLTQDTAVEGTGTTEETETTPGTDPTQGGDETPTTKPTTSTPTTPTEPTEPPLPNEYPYTLSYKEYLDMSEEKQIEFYNLFENHAEFKRWRTAAKKKYDDEKIEIEIGADGKIDLDQILNGNN